MTSELDDFRAALDGLRGSGLKEAAGLTEDDAQHSTVESGTNLAGLLQHLAFVESLWFEEIGAGGKAVGSRSMRVDPTTSLRKLRADYGAAWRNSNRVIEGMGNLDTPVSRHGKPHNLRWALLAVIQETARHAGHADIIREQIDGHVGR